MMTNKETSRKRLPSDKERGVSVIENVIEMDDSCGEDRRYVAKVAKNCVYIPESGIVIYSNKADEHFEWAHLISGTEMDTDKNNRYEIEVISTGNSDIIAMGLVPADFDTNRAPGWEKKSIAYHTDDGGIFIEQGFPAIKIITATRGDKISLELSCDKDKNITYHFQVRDQDMKLSGTNTGLYPCLSMRSRGAVRLLDDSLLRKDGCNNTGYDLQDIPTMSTKKTSDGIFISPAGTISFAQVRGTLYGVMSIYKPTGQPIAFEVCFGNKDTNAVRDVIAFEQAWVECLQIQSDDRPDQITVQWIRIHESDARKYMADKNWTLETIQKDRRRTKHEYLLTVEVEPIDEGLYDVSESPDHDPQATDEIIVDRPRSQQSIFTGAQSKRLFKLLCSAKGDDVVEDFISTTTQKGAKQDDFSVDGLLKILDNAKSTISDGKLPDETTMLENVKKILTRLEPGEVLKARDEELGYTPLHYAASFGSTKLMDLLFEQNKMIKYCAYVKSDAYFGQLPLQIAINGKHDKAAKVLVDIMTGKSIVDLFWDRNPVKIHLTIKDMLKSNLTETTCAVLDRFYEHGEWLMTPLELDDKRRDPTHWAYKKKDKTAYQMIADWDLKFETRKAFANHECVKALTQHKWTKYAAKMFWIPCLIYFLSWAALTAAAVIGVMKDDVTKYSEAIDIFRVGCEGFAYVYAAITFLGEILQLRIQGRHYWYDGFNYLDILSSLLILIVLPLRLTNTNAQWGVFCFGYIFWTFRIMKFITMSRNLGQLGFIIQRLVFDVLKFVVYFLIILLSFSGGLVLALKGDDNLNVHDETSTLWGILFVGVRVLVEGGPLGDLEYTGPMGYRPLSCIVMMLFLAFTCVVMLNIFIAQLSSRYNNEHESVDEKFETQRAKTIAKFELGEDLMSFIRLFARNPMWVTYFRSKSSDRGENDLDDEDDNDYDDAGCNSSCIDIICTICIYTCIICFLPCYCIYLFCIKDEDLKESCEDSQDSDSP